MAPRVIAPIVILLCLACGGTPTDPSNPTNPTTVRIVFAGSTTRRSNLPASALPCANSVTPTHIHPSWRNFATVPLNAVPPDRYELTFNDIPFDTRVTFRINDQNFCDETATGAVTRNVFANDVPLVQNATTPGQGDEPGYAITLSRSGKISQ